MSLRALIGALVGFSAALGLLLCLAETRDWFGQRRWGVAWVSRGGLLRFDAIGWPLVYLAIFAVPFGYVIGDRMWSRRSLVFALAGAVLGAALMWLLPARGSIRDSQAAHNHQMMASFLGALAGSAVAAEIAMRLDLRRPK